MTKQTLSFSRTDSANFFRTLNKRVNKYKKTKEMFSILSNLKASNSLLLLDKSSKKNIFSYTSTAEIPAVIRKKKPDIIWHNMAISQQKKSCQTLPNLTFTFSRLKPVEQNHYELLANAHYGKAKVSVVSRVAWVAGADVERLAWQILPQKLTHAMP